MYTDINKSNEMSYMKKHARFEQFVDSADSMAPKRTPEEAAKLLLSDEIGGYDKKIIANTVSEFFETAKMMQGIRQIPKITVFGSARTQPDHPDYILCKEFCKQMADLGYMTITGAGPGIMQAGHEGAGADNSIGVGIELPFETGVNEHTAQSKHIITYKYFFSRKLTFVREADAIVLFPGGFGTMDEAFEALTLLHTGRAMPIPLVLMEHEGSSYWEKWLRFVKQGLLDENTISPEDMYLFRRFHTTVEAVDYINNFYRRYHSLRYYGDKVIIRLNTPVPDALLEDLREEYEEFLGEFGIQKSETLAIEEDEPDIAHLPRLIIQANRKKPVDLYCLIRSLNREVLTSSTRRQDRKASKKYPSQPHPRPRREKVTGKKKK